jgi:hypothetical protein
VNAPLQVSLTDDPFPYPFLSQVAVLLQRIEIEQAGGSWITLQEWGANPGLYDLATLANGQTRSLVARGIPTGSYDSVRVTFAGGKVHSTIGIAFPAVAVGPQVVAQPLALTLTGAGAALLVDVDAASSFAIQGASFLNGKPLSDASQIAGVTFSPVLRVAVVGTGGGISGNVQDSFSGPVGGATVHVLASGTPVGSTLSDGAGNYAFLELPPGSYSLVAEAMNEPVPATVDMISVIAGSTQNVPLLFGLVPVPVPSPSPSPSPAPVASPSPDPSPSPGP